jgi:methylated-DNA-[protein]-cysteine S-methyltransferase
VATAAGKRALAGHRRVLRRLDAWGAAVVDAPARRRGPGAVAPPAPGATVVYYGSLATPVGPVLAAIGNRGLVGVSFRRSARAFRADLQHCHAGRVLRDDTRLAAVHRQLAGYFAGTLRRFDLPVDLSRVSAFQRRVLTAARRIPMGRVVSYGEIAHRIGQPRASRAVGQALGHNPVPIVIPCHRVVAGGGGLGGYIGGATIKRKLLALEGAQQATGS